MMKACLLGSPGVVVEISRLERLAYNAAFDELGLGVYWSVATYGELLSASDGLLTLESVVDSEWPIGIAEEVQALKHRHFERFASGGLPMRPGVSEVISFCKRNDILLGWITSAEPALLDSLLRHTQGLDERDFDVVLSQDAVEGPEPGAGAYVSALKALNASTSEVVAVTDSEQGQCAAFTAGLQCYLYPGEYAAVDHKLLLTRDLYQTISRAHSLWAVDRTIEAGAPGAGAGRC